MGSDGSLAIYTSFYGWHLGGVLWFILASIGVVFLPVLGTVIDCATEARSRGSFFRIDADSAISPLLVRLFIMLMVAIVAGVPAAGSAITPSTFFYDERESVLNETATRRTSDEPGSPIGDTMDTSGFDPTSGSVMVPAWWFIVMRYSQGIKGAMLEQIGTDGEAYRTIRSITNNLSIANPEIRRAVNDFFTNCYLPAVTAYRRDADERLSPTTPDGAAVVGADVSWLGTRVFTAPGGDYHTRRVGHRVPGYAFDAAVDTEHEGASAPASGNPLCITYWNGIAEDIAAEAAETGVVGILSRGRSYLNRWIGTGAPTNDEIARIYLEKTPIRVSGTADEIAALRKGDVGFLEGTVRGAANIVQGVRLTPIVIGMELALDALIQGLIILQAYTLMFTYALIPLGLIVSRFSIGFLVGGALWVFSINFFSVLWAGVAWIDATIAEALWDGQNYIEVLIYEGPSEYNKRLVHALAVMMLYVFSTTVLGAVLAIAGSRVGYAIGGAASSPITGGGGVSAARSVNPSTRTGRMAADRGRNRALDATADRGRDLVSKGRGMMGR